jgi:hypothetical protein
MPTSFQSDELVSYASKMIMWSKREAEELLILVGSKGTVDMSKKLCGRLSQCQKMLLQISEQKLKTAATMIMRHHPARDPPEPFNAVGVRIIGW